ncbi:capsid protein [Antarctic virus 4_II_KPSTAsw014Ch]|nr:capsid protein [Antarctic virus 4_II_KPSTAsw014Ch]QNG41128.1 capsid protein [Antarctic virus 4_II_KPSTAsw015Ch]
MASYRRRRLSRSRRRPSYASRRPRRRFARRRSRRGPSLKGSSSQRSIMAKLMRSITTPKTYKTVIAENYAGRQALRSVYGFQLGGEQLLQHLAKSRPANYLWNLNAGTNPPDTGAPLFDLTNDTNYNLHIDKYIVDSRIQNRSNASMELKIYECVVRRDASKGDAGFNGTKFDPAIIFHRDLHPTTIVDGNTNQNPVFDTGDQSLPAGVTHSWQHPGFTPYQSQTFTTSYKILRTHKLDLSPNQIVPMKFSVRAKGFKGRWLTSEASSEYQANWTKLIVFSWVGMPVDDGIASGQMARAKCDLYVTSDITIKHHFSPGTVPLTTFSYQNFVNSDVNNYVFNPAGFVPVIPASDTIQTTIDDSVDPETPLPAP